MSSLPSILSYSDALHRAQGISLWNSVFGYSTPHNGPELAIDKKVQNNDELFFVAVAEGTVVGTIMAGYDGHRGWLYSLAVDQLRRRHKIGTVLVAHAERALAKLGCVKINLQIMEGNEEVVGFYVSLGFSVENRISMGKRMDENIPPR